MMRYPKPQRYTVKNREKFVGNPDNVVARSSWERKLMIYCDYNKNVVAWGSESFPIDYWSSVDGKSRRYFIDFFMIVQGKDGQRKKYAIEVKPRCQTVPPRKGKNERRYLEELVTYQRNVDKWKAAQSWAESNGFTFKILTEYELGIVKKKNGQRKVQTI